LFNNWISTEWIDGSNGINEVTKVSTTGDAFTIDALNLANKVYNMLNRIAISGGSYDDWLDAVYTHERAKSCENPIYHGSLIKELAFEEVVSNAAGEQGGAEQPLGTLAGRGRLTGKSKGGKIKVKIDEPSYLIGIVSITPRIDYSQGNKWDTNLKTMNDLHKPGLDSIGFQDLVTDQMAWFDTELPDTGTPTYSSAGKQPAWINYMTNVNQTRGMFAEENNSMFMTLNRKYEADANGIADLTTYVDPSKFNNIFAEEELTAQNFWVQIGLDIFARRKMSAKIIPNL
jgi:acyl carrier protein